MTASVCAGWCWMKALPIPTSRSWLVRCASRPSHEDDVRAAIGVVRTDLQFTVGQRLPRTRAQPARCRAVLGAACPNPVSFRTLDMGGDKSLPYMETVGEENPAPGWRAIRRV